MESYGTELRGEVLAACDRKEGTRAIAARWKVSESWVRRLKQRRRETGEVAPRTRAPRKPKWHAWSDWLLKKLAEQPDIYLRELKVALKQERGEEACLMTICVACRALDQTRKKRR
jgi:transposase